MIVYNNVLNLSQTKKLYSFFTSCNNLQYTTSIKIEDQTKGITYTPPGFDINQSLLSSSRKKNNLDFSKGVYKINEYSDISNELSILHSIVKNDHPDLYISYLGCLRANRNQLYKTTKNIFSFLSNIKHPNKKCNSLVGSYKFSSIYKTTIFFVEDAYIGVDNNMLLLRQGDACVIENEEVFINQVSMWRHEGSMLYVIGYQPTALSPLQNKRYINLKIDSNTTFQSHTSETVDPTTTSVGKMGGTMLMDQNYEDL